MRKMIFLFCYLAGLGVSVTAQNKISFDVASVTNRHSSLSGLNVSSFYHFSERFAAGLEMNRFFPTNKTVANEAVQQSAWDFDLNFHYLLPLNKHVKLYPLTGISHTSEKELNTTTKEIVMDKFWSYNTGAGLIYELGKWSPHIEYSYTWGQINQQFLIAGLSYELELGRHHKE